LTAISFYFIIMRCICIDTFCHLYLLNDCAGVSVSLLQVSLSLFLQLYRKLHLMPVPKGKLISGVFRTAQQRGRSPLGSRGDARLRGPLKPKPFCKLIGKFCNSRKRKCGMMLFAMHCIKTAAYNKKALLTPRAARDSAPWWIVIQYRHFAEICVLYPSLIRRLRSLTSLWNSTVKLSVRKLESWGYSVVKVAWS